MRYQYVVILKKTSERATDLLSSLLCLISSICFIFFGYSSYYKPEWSHAWSYLLFVAAASLLFGLALNTTIRQRKRPIRYRYLLFLAGMAWLILTTFPWVAAFYFLLVFLETQAKRPLEIGFHHDRVVINTLIKQRYDWSAFNNIVLKDGLLTMDFANNRLLQKEVADDEDEDDADEEEFNAFCRARLAAITPA